MCWMRLVDWLLSVGGVELYKRSFIYYVCKIFLETSISDHMVSGGKKCKFFGKFGECDKWMIPKLS